MEWHCDLDMCFIWCWYELLYSKPSFLCQGKIEAHQYSLGQNSFRSVLLKHIWTDNVERFWRSLAGPRVVDTGQQEICIYILEVQCIFCIKSDCVVLVLIEGFCV